MNKFCACCGKEFVVSREHKSYCSKECRGMSLRKQKADHIRRVRAEHCIKRKCKWCGKEFVVSREHRYFCSKECKMETIDPLEFSKPGKRKYGHLDVTINKLRKQGKTYAEYQKESTPVKVDVVEIMKDIYEPCKECFIRDDCDLKNCVVLNEFLRRK